MMNTQRCDSCRQTERDIAEAAGELCIPIDEAPPGSTVRKLLMANSMLRQKLSAMESELANAQWELENNSDALADAARMNGNW